MRQETQPNPRGYDEIADWHDELVETGPLYHDMIVPTLLVLAGDVRNQRILDVACGQGLATRELAQRGATVTGADISPRMLELARRRELDEPLGIDYRDGDAETLAGLPASAFDGATCCMGLMNITNLRACAASLRRVLRNAGWFVAVITHPCFQTPRARWVERDDGKAVREVSGYFDECFWQSDDPSGVRGKVGEHHRTLSTYLNTFFEAGFTLARISEPQATGRHGRDVPGNLEVPAIMALRFVKTV